MNPLYTYSDYRVFLRERLKSLKRADRSFTYTKFAALAGFKSPGFLTQVLQGGSNLTLEMADRFAATLDLNIDRVVQINVHAFPLTPEKPGAL